MSLHWLPNQFASSWGRGRVSSYQLYTLIREKDEYARFLETSTFGVTEEDLNKLEAAPNSVQENIASWISNQMNSSITPMSSLREFYRHGLVPRVSQTQQKATELFLNLIIYSIYLLLQFK